jgi:hypothetical protein
MRRGTGSLIKVKEHPLANPLGKQTSSSSSNKRCKRVVLWVIAFSRDQGPPRVTTKVFPAATGQLPLDGAAARATGWRWLNAAPLARGVSSGSP